MTVLLRPACRLAGMLTLASSSAFAAMGNTATSYGLLPGDIASAQALSLFNPDVSAVFYNPAHLTADPRGELTLGLSIADHRIKADSLGGTAPLSREGELLPVDESELNLIGLKTDLSSLTKAEHPLYLGVMIGIEKYGRQMLAFESETSTQGQYFRYGRQPLFLAVGGGTRLWRGVAGGASLRVTLHADASLSGQSDLAGNTEYEQLTVAAKPSLRPIVGLSVDWAETLCPDGDCALRGWHSAFAYRHHADTRTRVDANVVIPGTIPPPGLDLAISTLDGYQPNTVSLGLQYQGEGFRVGLTGEWQQWSELEAEFRDDTVRDQANLRFDDTFIPRLGGELQLGERYTLTAGLAYEPAALASDRSLDVNYLDNDRYILGLGARAELKDPWIFAHPVRLDFGYQLHWLKERQFDLVSTRHDDGATPYETLEVSGQAHVFTGSLTMKF